jgi:hypothetical protein
MAEPKEEYGLLLVDEDEHLTKQEKKTFNSIKLFVSALFSTFGKKVPGLSKYHLLLKETTFENVFAVKKNINIFTSFIVSNAEHIKAESKDFLSSEVVRYSPNCRIEFGQIMSQADEHTKGVIWDHIIVIASHANPSCVPKKAKNDIVSKKLSDDKIADDLDLPDTKEGNMLKGIVSSVADVFDNDKNGIPANPMEGMAKLFTTGFVQNLAGQFQEGDESGELDLNNLLSAFGSMMSSKGLKGTDNSNGD